MTNTTLIYNAKLLDENINSTGAVLVENGKIKAVYLGSFTDLAAAKALCSSAEFFDAKGLTLTPAFIDMHVHMRYPGQTQKEDLNTGLHATAAGGFGTVVAMPNTNPVVSSYQLALQIEKEAAQIGLTKLYQAVSITKDFGGTDTNHLKEIEKENIPVITEDGHDVLSSSVMLDGMEIAGKKGIIVSCHSEAPTLADKARPYRQQALKIMKEYGLSAWGTNEEEMKAVPAEKLAEIDSLLTKANSLLAVAEDSATYRNIELAKEAGCAVHIAHCSTKKSIDAVRAAKKELEQARKNGTVKGSFNVTVEITPHHIGLCGTYEPQIRALVNPPLRHEEDRLALIEALRDGTGDVISTDHAPHTAEDKAAGSPGFTGAETAFAVCNTVLVKENGFSLNQLSKLMSANPARILGLKKGLLQPGYDADFALIAPEEEWIVDSSKFQSKGKATPFEGRKLTGKVHGLILNGKKVF